MINEFAKQLIAAAADPWYTASVHTIFGVELVFDGSASWRVECVHLPATAVLLSSSSEDDTPNVEQRQSLQSVCRRMSAGLDLASGPLKYC